MQKLDEFSQISAEITAALLPIANRHKKHVHYFCQALEAALVFFISIGAKHPGKELSAVGNRIGKSDWKSLALLKKRAKEDGKAESEEPVETVDGPGTPSDDQVFQGDPRAFRG